MKKMFVRLWNEDDGVLSFEWILLLTLLVIGIVSGVSAARDAIIDEFGDVAQAMLSLDQSYTIDFPLNVDVHTVDATSASDSSFTDALIYTDCGRTTAPLGQVPQFVLDSDS
ncbi:MAG: Flp family type IVb pilin [Pirellulaceae bacterium]